MCRGMFIFHVTLEWLGAASWCIHSETQQGLVPPRRVLNVPELKLEVEWAHLFPGREKMRGFEIRPEYNLYTKLLLHVVTRAFSLFKKIFYCKVTETRAASHSVMNLGLGISFILVNIMQIHGQPP